MLRRLYAKLIERDVNVVPNHIMLVADEGLIKNFNKFLKFLEWSKKFGIKEVTICFSDVGEIDIEKLKNLGYRINVLCDGRIFEVGNRASKLTLNLIFGYKGKHEIVDILKKLAILVEVGKLDPSDVDENIIERFLLIKSSPDLIIKAGKEIPDFLIWQSVYSELYFIDLNWESFRYIDFLRCLRDFQRRERRYGR